LPVGGRANGQFHAGRPASRTLRLLRVRAIPVRLGAVPIERCTRCGCPRRQPYVGTRTDSPLAAGAARPTWTAPRALSCASSLLGRSFGLAQSRAYFAVLVAAESSGISRSPVCLPQPGLRGTGTHGRSRSSASAWERPSPPASWGGAFAALPQAFRARVRGDSMSDRSTHRASPSQRLKPFTLGQSIIRGSRGRGSFARARPGGAQWPGVFGSAASWSSLADSR